jgi:hypothetical protein
MGVKSKGGMYCDYCQRPVAGIRSTHAARGTVGLVAAPFTGGLSLFGMAPDAWHCPTCGQRVRKAQSQASQEFWAGWERGQAERRAKIIRDLPTTSTKELNRWLYRFGGVSDPGMRRAVADELRRRGQDATP